MQFTHLIHKCGVSVTSLSIQTSKGCYNIQKDLGKTWNY